MYVAVRANFICLLNVIYKLFSGFTVVLCGTRGGILFILVCVGFVKNMLQDNCKCYVL